MSHSTHRSVAVMQPTYLPWIGYFALIERVDKFVFFDNVQFSYRSWQRYNRIKTRQGITNVSISVTKDAKRNCLIQNVMTSTDVSWAENNLNLISENYRNAPYFDEVYGILEHSLHTHSELLCDLNIALIRGFCDYMGMDTNRKFVKASELDVAGVRSEYFVQVAKKLGCNQYVSPVGSLDYIKEENVIQESDIDLKFVNYEHPVYAQQFGDFIPYLSIIDLLCNEGPKAKNIIVSGLRQDHTLEELIKLKHE